MRVARTDLIHAVTNAMPNGRDAKELIYWLSMVRSSTWLGPSDVTAMFPNATSSNGVWIFRLPTSPLLVKAIIGFRGSGQVVIQEVR